MMKSVKLTCGLFLALCLVQPSSALGGCKSVDRWDKMSRGSCDLKTIKAWYNLMTRQSELVGDKEAILREFSRKCVAEVANFMDGKIDAFERKVPKRQLGRVHQFLSDEFIALYRRDNPRDPQLHVGYHPDETRCCEPSRSVNVVKSSFIKLLQNLGTPTSPAPARDAVEAIFHKHVEAPCKIYYKATKDKFRKFRNVLERHRTSLIERQSEKLKAAVFRFQWCWRITDAYEYVRSGLIDAITSHLNPPDEDITEILRRNTRSGGTNLASIILDERTSRPDSMIGQEMTSTSSAIAPDRTPPGKRTPTNPVRPDASPRWSIEVAGTKPWKIHLESRW